MTLPDWTNHGVLLYGARKAGTTLLQHLHDGGGELLVFPAEVKLKAFLGILWHPQPEGARLYYDQSNLLDREFPGFDSNRYRSEVNEVMDGEIEGLRDVMQKDIHAVYKCLEKKPSRLRCWGLKEVGGDTLGVVKLWRHMFMNGKIVMIVRQPAMVARSVLNDRRKRGIRLGMRQIYKEVSDPIRVLHQQSRLLGDETVHFTVYEQITNEGPEQVMRNVSKYLDIEYNPVFEQPTTFGKQVVPSTASVQRQGIFKSEGPWYQGLTALEQACVYVFTKLANTRLRMRSGREGWLSYGEVVGRIREREGFA